MLLGIGSPAPILFVLVLLPLWASYLARVYAWQLILNHDGLLNWSLQKVGLVYAAFERIPHSYIEASRDLGGKGWRTIRSIILPLALPGIVAGSIFTFSLTLGDYITPLLVGGASSQFIGNVVYSSILNSQQPFASAFAVVPVVVMGIYLLIARRLGAFDAL